MKTYKISSSTINISGVQATKFVVGFSEPSTNDVIVREVAEYLAGEGKPAGGRILLIDGPASLPVAFAMCHAAVHMYGAVAIKDPKMGAYVVAVSHSPDFPVGTLVKE